MVAWLEEIVGPHSSQQEAVGMHNGGDTASGRDVRGVLESEARYISSNVAPLRTNMLRNIPSAPPSSTSQSSSNTARGGGARASTSTSRPSGSRDGSGGSSSGRLPPITASYEELMKLRAKELKKMLVDRGVLCGDCFEKEQLARRIVEQCSV